MTFKNFRILDNPTCYKAYTILPMDELFGTHTTDTLTTEQLPAFGILNYNRISLTVNGDIKTRAIINTKELNIIVRCDVTIHINKLVCEKLVITSSSRNHAVNLILDETDIKNINISCDCIINSTIKCTKVHITSATKRFKGLEYLTCNSMEIVDSKLDNVCLNVNQKITISHSDIKQLTVTSISFTSHHSYLGNFKSDCTKCTIKYGSCDVIDLTCSNSFYAQKFTMKEIIKLDVVKTIEFVGMELTDEQTQQLRDNKVESFFWDICGV